MHVEGEREESKVASPLKSLHMLQSNWQENTIHPGPVQALPGDTGKGWTHPELRELTIQYLGPARGRILALPCCVALDKSLRLSGFHLPHMQNKRIRESLVGYDSKPLGKPFLKDVYHLIPWVVGTFR